ncbi:hypothetical protein [Streptomyces sp. NPDC048191]
MGVEVIGYAKAEQFSSDEDVRVTTLAGTLAFDIERGTIVVGGL